MANKKIIVNTQVYVCKGKVTELAEADTEVSIPAFQADSLVKQGKAVLVTNPKKPATKESKKEPEADEE